MKHAMQQVRQPKGTATGGQFAPDVNPETTVELRDAQDGRDLECSQCGSEASFASDLAATSAGWQIGADTVCAHCVGILSNRATPTPLQKANSELEALRLELKQRRGTFNLEEIVAGNICSRLGDQGKFEQVLEVINDWQPGYDRFDMAMSSETDWAMDERHDDLVAIFGELDY